MVCHNTNERSIIETTVRHPGRELAVPNQSMATKLKSPLCCIVGNCVRSAPRKLISIWFSCIPLHGVLRSDWSEICFVIDDIAFGTVATDRQRCANVRTSLGCNGTLETGRLTRFETKHWVSARKFQVRIIKQDLLNWAGRDSSAEGQSQYCRRNELHCCWRLNFLTESKSEQIPV